MANDTATESGPSSFLERVWEKYKSWPLPLVLGSLVGILFATEEPLAAAVWWAVKFGMVLSLVAAGALLLVELVLESIRRAADRL